MESITFDDEVARFTRIAQMRYEISRMMYVHQMVSEISPSDAALNPYYGRTSKSLNTGIVVEFLNDVIPYCLYTPYGAMEINPHTSKEMLALTYSFLTEEQKVVFLKDFKEKFGATIIQSCQTTRTEGTVLQPAIYNLGKLPSENTVQSTSGTVIPLTTALPSQQIDAEQIHWKQICNRVDENLRAAGHPEMTFRDANIPKLRSMITAIHPKSTKYLEDKMKNLANNDLSCQ